MTCATRSRAPSPCRPRCRWWSSRGTTCCSTTTGSGPSAGLLDESWFLAPDDDVRLARLVARHERFGKSPEAARAWSHGPDEGNARLVAATAARADVVVPGPDDRCETGRRELVPRTRRRRPRAPSAATSASLAAHAPTAQVMAVVKADALRPRPAAHRGRGPRPAAPPGSVPRRSTRRSRCGAAGVTGARSPHLAVRARRPAAGRGRGRRRRVGVSALGARRAGGRRPCRRASRHARTSRSTRGWGATGWPRADLRRSCPRCCACRPRVRSRTVGLWSHLAFADEPEHPAVRAAGRGLRGGRRSVEGAGVALEVRHLANSAATLTTPDVHYDLVRPGVAVYGLSPVPQLGGPDEFGLVPAMTLEAELATVKRVPGGPGRLVRARVRHRRTTPCWASCRSATPTASRGTRPARRTGWAGPCRSVAARSGVAGRVCMDQVVLDLGPDATERSGRPRRAVRHRPRRRADRAGLGGGGRDHLLRDRHAARARVPRVHVRQPRRMPV